MFYLKAILDDIIDVAYADNPKLDLYKKYYIVNSYDKTRKSKHGEYNLSTHEIKLYNFGRGTESVLKTLIHEVAHHVDWANRGTTGHGHEFYGCYRRLLYAALDMGLYKPEFFNVETDSSRDREKVARMIAEYQPHPVDYKRDKYTISVSGGYEKKDILKGLGFRFNDVNKTWDKEVSDEAIPDETARLADEGLRFEVEDARTVQINHPDYIYAKAGSYDYKDQLKADGFRYNKEKKCWVLKCKNAQTANEMLIELQRKYPTVLITKNK